MRFVGIALFGVSPVLATGPRPLSKGEFYYPDTRSAHSKAGINACCHKGSQAWFRGGRKSNSQSQQHPCSPTVWRAALSEASGWWDWDALQTHFLRETALYLRWKWRPQSFQGSTCAEGERGDLELASRELPTAMVIMIHREKEKTGSWMLGSWPHANSVPSFNFTA